MRKGLLFVLLPAVAAFGQYTLEQAGPPPAEVAPAMAAELQQQGSKIVASDGSVWAELWFRNSSVEGPETGEIDVSWNNVAHGTFIGVIRFPGQGEERRGQVIQPGVYTLRFSFYPVDGNHEGVEPSRDFLMLSPAAIDKDPNARPGFDELMEMSRKASGTPHPAGLSMWKGESDWKPGLSKLGEQDWVLNVKVGETPISVIVKGVNQG